LLYSDEYKYVSESINTAVSGSFQKIT